jgi:Ras-related protein Rab-7A
LAIARKYTKRHLKTLLFSVGKTSIIQNYIRKTISSGYKPTIGADFFSKKLEIVNGDDTVSVTMQVWDTAG